VAALPSSVSVALPRLPPSDNNTILPGVCGITPSTTSDSADVAAWTPPAARLEAVSSSVELDVATDVPDRRIVADVASVAALPLTTTSAGGPNSESGRLTGTGTSTPAAGGCLDGERCRDGSRRFPAAWAMATSCSGPPSRPPTIIDVGEASQRRVSI
jgi:hypothetical protein